MKTRTHVGTHLVTLIAMTVLAELVARIGLVGLGLGKADQPQKSDAGQHRQQRLVGRVFLESLLSSKGCVDCFLVSGDPPDSGMWCRIQTCGW